jgi:hypothetical protein
MLMVGLVCYLTATYIYEYIYSVDDRVINEYGAVGRTRIGSGNRSTWRKPAPVPLSLKRIPHDFTWDRTQVATVGSRRLTA